MSRKYERKTERSFWDEQKMNEVVAMVQKSIKLRCTADACHVPRTTLSRNLQKLLHKSAGSKHLGKLCLFGPEKELEFVNHITEFERKGLPLTTMDIRKLAYKFAVRNNIKHSFNNVTQTASIDWWIGLKNDIKIF